MWGDREAPILLIREPESDPSRAFLEITPKLLGMISVASETAGLEQAPKPRTYVVRGLLGGVTMINTIKTIKK